MPNVYIVMDERFLAEQRKKLYEKITEVVAAVLDVRGETVGGTSGGLQKRTTRCGSFCDLRATISFVVCFPEDAISRLLHLNVLIGEIAK